MDQHERDILETVNIKVNQIHQAVFGVENQLGLVRKVEEHDRAIKDLDNFRTKTLAAVMVVVVGVEILLKFLK